jgi:hypothetical protein
MAASIRRKDVEPGGQGTEIRTKRPRIGTAWVEQDEWLTSAVFGVPGVQVATPM